MSRFVRFTVTSSSAKLNDLPGSDAAAHMSEEVKDAGMVVPRAMMTSFFANGFMGLVVLISFLFSIQDLSDALNDKLGYPWLYAMRTSLSDGAVTGLTVVILLLALSSNIDFNASASRQAFALARDRGFPFSSWISRVRLHPRHFPAWVSPGLLRMAEGALCRSGQT